MEGIQKYIQKISSKTGEDKVSIDKPSRVVHRISYGMKSLLHENLRNFTAAAVVRSRITKEARGEPLLF